MHFMARVAIFAIFFAPTCSICALVGSTSIGGGYAVQPVDLTHRRLIFVRHGAVAPHLCEPPLRANAFYGAGHNVPLSTSGVAEAHATAEIIRRFHSEEVSSLCASPLAMHTSAILREPLRTRIVGGLPVKRSALLTDVDRGRWVNLTRDEVADRWGADAFERWCTDHEAGCEITQGEGVESVRSRALVMRVRPRPRPAPTPSAHAQRPRSRRLGHHQLAMTLLPRLVLQ